MTHPKSARARLALAFLALSGCSTAAPPPFEQCPQCTAEQGCCQAVLHSPDGGVSFAYQCGHPAGGNYCAPEAGAD